MSICCKEDSNLEGYWICDKRLFESRSRRPSLSKTTKLNLLDSLLKEVCISSDCCLGLSP